MHRQRAALRRLRERLRPTTIIWACLAVFFFVAFFPLVLYVTGLSGPCDLSRKPSWFESANPLSPYNLCRMQHSMANAHTAVEEQKARPQRIVQEAESPPPPPSPSPRPPPLEPPSPQFPPEPKAPQPPPRAVAKPAQQKPQQQQADAATQSSSQSVIQPSRPHNQIDDEIDEIEYPKSDEDYERILRFPHYDECNLCKVCVPYPVMEQYVKKKTTRKVTERQAVATEDPDVILETVKPVGKPGTTRQAGQRQLSVAQQILSTQSHTELHAQTDTQQGSGIAQTGSSSSSSSSSGASNGQTVVRRQGRRLQVDSDHEETESDGLYYVKGNVIDIHGIAPGDTKSGPRAHLPNCTVCWGCSHTLEMMAMGTVQAGSYYSHEPGGSPSWLFRVRTNRTGTGWAVAKLWCVPVRKVKQRGLAMCSPKKVYSQVKLLLAQNKVIRQCGFDTIVPSMWVEPVVGVIPGHGFRIDWLALWAEIADGTSVQNIQEYGHPRTNPEYMLDLFTNKINHQDVTQTALFDVLFSQCDRHQQNIFINEKGKVWAIDNDQVYSVAWRPCGFDSMVLPTTQKFMINHLGFFYVLKYPQKDPPKKHATSLNPLLLFDYRCHAPGGAIGFNYPDKLKQCLKNISAMTVDNVQEAYGYPSIRMAEALHNRTVDLKNKGFEWTLLHGEPSNQPMHRYKVAPSCCSMRYNKREQEFECTHNYTQMHEIPFGNPWHGGKWHGTPGKDTGSYVGGTEFR